MSDGIERLTTWEAKRALETAGPVVHCITGTGEHDMDLAAAKAVVEKAKDVAWVTGILGHDLVVLTDERLVLRFAVKKPCDVKMTPARLELLRAVERGNIVRIPGTAGLHPWDAAQGTFVNRGFTALRDAGLVELGDFTSTSHDRPYRLTAAGRELLAGEQS